MTLLASHFERIQSRLKAEGDVAKSFTHGLNRGQVREAFIREFLVENISDVWGIGTGEIIHKNSTNRDIRNQIDVVVHNKKFPKLSFAKGIDLFFIETVSSFIEIKSHLTKSGLRKAIATTKNIKSLAKFPLQRHSPVGPINTPRPYSFVFSYDGPKKIETVLKWLREISTEDEYGIEALQNTDPNMRQSVNHNFVDGVFILGRGFVHVDALPFNSNIGQAIEAGHRVSPKSVWVLSREKELLALWTILNRINELLLWAEADLLRYIGDFTLELEDYSDD